MCSLELEPAEVWDEHVRRARKLHECDGCWSAIRPGDYYLTHFDIYEGQTNNEKMCAACWMARENFDEAHGQSICPSTLIQTLRDCVGENDDEEDVWRPVLANVLNRYRQSPRMRGVRQRKLFDPHALPLVTPARVDTSNPRPDFAPPKDSPTG